MLETIPPHFSLKLSVVVVVVVVVVIITIVIVGFLTPFFFV